MDAATAPIDPLAGGILMPHQRAWLEDPAPLKLMEKGRRTGVTWAEALDATIVASSARSAGGDNVYYIGDTRDKGREFCGTVAGFARSLAKELAEVEEFLFDDKRPDGESKFITAFRVRFASGYAVVALSSRPANIRGLQGIVIVDEAAFHADVSEVLAAVNALLIWGGKIRVISTHNGDDNPFNQLLRDCRKGLYGYSVHRVTFADAIDNGLYGRVCLVNGWEPTAQGQAKWYDMVLGSYGHDSEWRDEELFCVPRRGGGVYMPRSLVLSCAAEGIPVLRLTRPAEWYLDPDRLSQADAWYGDQITPILAALPQDRPCVLGEDFGRDGDLTAVWVLQREPDRIRWKTVLLLELRRVPFDVQGRLLTRLIGELPLFLHGKFDARGNGQQIAEDLQQRFGIATIDCVKATPEWYALHFPRYRAAYEERRIIVPDSEDVALDHASVVLVRGRPTMDDKRTRGSDGAPRHGDTAVAGLLAWAATEETAASPIEFRSAGGPWRGLSAWDEGPLMTLGGRQRGQAGVLKTLTGWH